MTDERRDELGGATGRAAAPRTAGPRGCIIAALVTSALGFGSVVAGKIFFEIKNASVLSGADELGAIVSAAEVAPGADALKPLGCDSAGVLSGAALHELGERLELEDARRKNRTPRPITVSLDESVVFCARKPSASDPPPSCAAIATAYRHAILPEAPFVVTVRTGPREACAERFDPAGASLGPAPSPNLPVLVPPS
jgi:hypothetical protein